MDQPLQLEIAKARRNERRLTLHDGTAHILSESSSLVEAAPRLLQTIGESFGAGRAAFWNVEHEPRVLRCLGVWRAAGIQATEFNSVSSEMTLALGQGLPGRAWQSGKPAWLTDVDPEPRYVRARKIQTPRMRSSVAFPILLDGETLGVIDMVGDASRLPTHDDIRELIGISSHIAQFIKRKHAEEQYRTHVWFLESMSRVSHAIQATDDVDQMVNSALDEMLSLFDCDRAWVYFCGPESRTWAAPLERTRLGFSRKFDTSADVALEPAVCQAFQKEMAGLAPIRFGPGSEWPVPAQLARRFGVRSMIAMAIGPKGGGRYLLGLHQCSHPRLWTQQHERLFQVIASRLADAVSNVMMLQGFREMERKLEEAQRISHIGYWDRDVETNLINLSDETYRIFGLNPGESCIDFPQQHDLIHPEDREMVLETEAAALAGGARYELEYRVVRPNGEVRVVHSQGDVTKDNSGRPQRISGTVQDVTAQRMRERERKELRRQLRQANKMAMIGRLAAGIAHDVNHTVGSILRATELAQKVLSEEEVARRHIDAIRQDATRAKILVDRVLAFRCTELHERGPVHVQSQVEEALAVLAASLPPHIHVQKQLDAGDVRVIGNAAGLHEAVISLCSNAVHGVKHASVVKVLLDREQLDTRRALSHGTLSPGVYVRLLVTDIGHGPSPAAFEALSDSPPTVNGLGEQAGPGFSLVQDIVADFGGAIDLETHAGLGTTYTIWLPVEKTAADRGSVQQDEFAVEHAASSSQDNQLLRHNLGQQ